MTYLKALTQQVTLGNGTVIPAIHLGTYLTSENETYRAVLDDLEVGYRAFDSAQMYGNEREVGSAISHWISQSKTYTRSGIFFTTKLAENQGYEKTLQRTKNSVRCD